MSKIKFYVTMTDKFMSGWGPARDKINKLVISCYTFDEARIVSDNAQQRSEMKYINILDSKPYYNKRTHCTSLHGRCQNDYESWFTPGYFTA